MGKGYTNKTVETGDAAWHFVLRSFYADYDSVEVEITNPAKGFVWNKHAKMTFPKVAAHFAWGMDGSPNHIEQLKYYKVFSESSLDQIAEATPNMNSAEWISKLKPFWESPDFQVVTTGARELFEILPTAISSINMFITLCNQVRFVNNLEPLTARVLVRRVGVVDKPRIKSVFDGKPIKVKAIHYAQPWILDLEYSLVRYVELEKYYRTYLKGMNINADKELGPVDIEKGPPTLLYQNLSYLCWTWDKSKKHQKRIKHDHVRKRIKRDDPDPNAKNLRPILKPVKRVFPNTPEFAR